MRKKKKKEDYSSSRTADLRNVIAEIQKVDQETADLSSVVEEVQKVEKKVDKGDALLTCRVLFSSIIDKFFLIILGLLFLYISYLNFKGDVFGATYGFWFRVLRELGIFILLVFGYAICNWIYNCIFKTIICLTPNSIYRECYFPFYRRETTIPYEHITSVSTVNFLWIFRSIIIYQYHSLPIVFFTWNNQKFKNKFDEINGYNTIHNSYQNRSMIQRQFVPVMQWFVIIFIMIIIVLGIVHFFGFIFSNERRVSGTYLKGNQKIELFVNGKCNIKMGKIKDLKSCTWTINPGEKTIIIKYKYLKNNYFGEAYEAKENITVGYEHNNIIYNGIEYKKK